jgi:hypothetical protein
METRTSYYNNEHGAEFTVRVWLSRVYDGWMFTISGEGMVPTSGKHAWATAHSAERMAQRFIDRHFA